MNKTTEKIRVSASFEPLHLKFKFDAGTSRGVLQEKHNYLLRIRSDTYPGLVGIGEAGPLVGLSLDDRKDFRACLQQVCDGLQGVAFSTDPDMILKEVAALVLEGLPSIRFALETALLDLIHGGRRRIFPNRFFDNQVPIPINGLVWMGEVEFMERQIEEKLAAGFSCIKMKIGAIDFDTEYHLLKKVRKRYRKEEITLRVDANGAFSPEDALTKLEKLSALDLHSIEQPIGQGQWEEMAKLCAHSPVPIALDEELIGIFDEAEKSKLLANVMPAFIILKPTLLGGIYETTTWIRLAEEKGIGWWMTSALESNVGLNAIAQFTATFESEMPQGLGTGQLYHNNIDSPLLVRAGYLWYDAEKRWANIPGGEIN
ncbi:MAG: o-succinylbenzoate synthase [Lunatimonas sp.]|uniref:o-succinylbenzoate synthase n=1 Tax=Lunatimonas sp. TaxID=2060141 RepID=UPI00263BE09A|nr:o-succinylbenzoate synthase [Lunatimonas sp.]MCC5936932.1 o-succinylbenzoate synthase [Lunatimonas sp.]